MRSPMVLPALALAAWLACASANEGEEADLPGGSVTAWTDSTELFMEHPALLAGVPARFAVHLTVVSGFAPLESGVVTLRFTPRGTGEPVVVRQEAPRSPGIYGPEVVLPRAGTWDLLIQVESPAVRDSIPVPGLLVHESAEAVPVSADGAEEGIAFLKEQQWRTPGFATAFADSGEVQVAVRSPGRLVAAAGRHAVVAAPIAGLVSAGSVSASPAPGLRVRAGEVLAHLTPTLGEGGAAYAAARAELREAEEEHTRAVRLFAVEAVPERRVHEARIRLDAAGEALAWLTGAGEPEPGRVTIRAPISGIIVTRAIVPGGRAAAGDPLFTIVDPSLLWLEAQVAAEDLGAVRQPSGAAFTVAGDTAIHRAGRLVSISAVVDSLTRSVTVLFEVPNPGGRLRVGELAQVEVLGGERERGMAVPRSALVDDDGQPVVFVQAEGERFDRRVVSLGPGSAGWVLVRSGLHAGERVVTGGAAVVRLASRSTALPAHGHEH